MIGSEEFYPWRKIYFCLIAIIQAMILVSLSQKTPITWDEAYAIKNSIQFSVWHILSGHTGEANVAPLYFLLLKFLSWAGLNVRLVAIVPTAMFIALVAHRWLRMGLFWSLTVVVLLNTTIAVTEYGWLARPYALWCFLTWVFLDSAINEKPKLAVFGAGLLAATTPFAIIQVPLLFILMLNYINPLTNGFLCAIYLYSFILCLKTPSYPFWWPGLAGFIPLVLHHARYWILIPTALLMYRLGAYFNFLIYMLLCISAVVFIFYIHQPGMNGVVKIVNDGFYITERYMIWLLPTTLAYLTRLWSEYEDKDIAL